MKRVSFLTVLKFILVWGALLLSANFFSHFNHLPMSVHQGAQCDRASLAQNYFYGNMNFFYPEVNEDRCVDGIVSCEFPLTSYLAAALYRTFGYDEFWFRLLSFLFAACGFFSLFLLIRHFLNEWIAFCLIGIIQFSPILLFYTNNFLPDIASFGLAFVAWYFFVRLYIFHPFEPNTDKWVHKLIFWLSMTLSIAIKTTSMIQWCTMMGVLTLSYIPIFKISLNARKNALWILLSSLMIPAIWWLWSRHLAQNHNSQYFMMRIPWISKESWISAWNVYTANWPHETFSRPLIYIFEILLIVPLFLFKWVKREWYFIYLLNFLGSLAFLLLMMEQFKYHDYYIICLLPAFVFSWVLIAMSLSKIQAKFWYLKILALILGYWALKYQFENGSKNFEERYTEGNYWEQSHLKASDYDSMRIRLKALGLKRSDCVLVGNDPAPNNMLYLLHLKGHRYSKDHTQERMDYVMNDSKPGYLISNDSTLTVQVNEYVDSLILICKYKNIEAYRILYKK